ncbi:MAG: YabP/YqfC family sporulation protein [Clostridia bacterium]|nr:YabP/YqfC family sporulation protein [Clostridia bacterium]
MGFDSVTDAYMKYKLIYTGRLLMLKGSAEISSYDENTLIIKCGKENIIVTGYDLVITMMNADELTVCGNIASISFE